MDAFLVVDDNLVVDAKLGADDNVVDDILVPRTMDHRNGYCNKPNR
ncbi:hypothetical protein [Kaarinaea lacus]